jgi:uncharacterized membrane protein
VLFAANVAPTEEIIVLGAQLSSARLLGLVIVSLALGALILYYSAFVNASTRVRGDTLALVAGGTAATYAVALAASAMLLWFFGRFEGQSLMTCVGQTVVLGLAAMLGASAGRLLLQ